MNILLASSEISPFAKTGGLGDVAESLPLLLNTMGVNASAIMPLYKLVGENGFLPKLHRPDIPIKMGGKEMKFSLHVTEFKGTKFYFIRNDELYHKDGLYGSPNGDHKDNALRFAFFSKAVLESIPFIGAIDLIHCNDWQTALVPLYRKYLSKDDATLEEKKVLYSIHNLAYQGLFTRDVMPGIDLPDDLFVPEELEFYDKISFMKSGILYSDAISTVSEGYAEEILTPEFGCGLDGILKTRKKKLHGILNGADYSTWNPEHDKHLIRNYSPASLKPKMECKADLSKEFGIPFNEEAPMIGMITRLAEQKGIDVVVDAMEEILELGANFVILGTGDAKYNMLCESINKRFKGKAGARIAFDNGLAHRIEAGSDIFLMPSRYEPCGLNQMYSLKYATVPVVRSTGGLKDTVHDFNPKTKKGNGFVFKKVTTTDMLSALKRAVETYKDKKTWSLLQANGLKCDFSWEASAKKYKELYKEIIG